MIEISKDDFIRLKKAGLIRDYASDKNYTIINRGKKSSHKKYFVMEETKIMKFLEIK